jgi:hypothetical protein
MSIEFVRERKSAAFTVALTLAFIPILIVFFAQGVDLAMLVFTIGFMLGCVFERVRLHRTIARLHARLGAEASLPSATSQKHRYT